MLVSVCVCVCVCGDEERKDEYSQFCHSAGDPSSCRSGTHDKA